MQVVIPAAGRGTRFAELDLGVPKELLPLGGSPLIGHALAEAARAGFEVAVIVLSPAKQQVRQYLAETKLPLPIKIVTQPTALGTGDAVLRGWQGEPIGVLLPDDVVLGSAHWKNLIELHRQEGAAALCVRSVPFQEIGRFGIAQCDGDLVVGLVEKPQPGTSDSNLAVLGRYVVTESVVAPLRGLHVEGEIELTHGFAAAMAVPPGVRAVRFGGEIYDCGTPAEYAASVARFPHHELPRAY
jgi:UTP-glucose-1-phosphate uridylyltransferase